MRIKRRVGRPTAAVMRRIWRLRPCQLISRQHPCPGRQGADVLDGYPLAQELQGLGPGGGVAFDLHPVAAPVAKAGIGEPLLESTVTGQQQQAFAVGIEAAGGIHRRHVDQVSQGLPAAAGFGAELAQYAIGFVQQQRCHGRRPRPRRRLS
jgi:hypothetical protein